MRIPTPDERRLSIALGREGDLPQEQGEAVLRIFL